MICIRKEGTNARLCKDGEFRTFASFGTEPSCVKVYCKIGWALRKQTILDNKGIETHVLKLPITHSMDASGRIFTRNMR